MQTLADYLTSHDGKPSPSGAECIRLAGAANVSAMYLYLAALGHKRFSPEKALLLHHSSIGGQLKPEAIRADVEWIRDGAGEITSYSIPVSPKVA
jgi:hypothetical protein